jgi:glyoxylase-like metal-dependent hydrolase (beta-lactamase superfamily II)
VTKLSKTNKETYISVCREIAPDVYCMEVGKGITRSNVYFVKSGPSWVLIDAASANCSRLIRNTAESLFGANTQPTSILLTHDHPDHAGSAVDLARMWSCPVYVHPDELPVSASADISTIRKYANPIDRWIILPLFRMMPQRRVESMLSRGSLKGVVQAFEPGVAIPSLPDWECIPTPGHTPGHVAFFRSSDRILITGDALLTVDLNSLQGSLLWALRINKQRISGPPWYSTWNRRAAKESVAFLSGLEPSVIASGHGMPMAGGGTARALRSFSDHFSVPTAGENADNRNR